jgi:hypothetical protein
MMFGDSTFKNVINAFFHVHPVLPLKKITIIMSGQLNFLLNGYRRLFLRDKTAEREDKVRFQVLTEVSVKMTVFWDAAPCNLVVDKTFQRSP